MEGLTRNDQSLLWLIIGLAVFCAFIGLAGAFGISTADYSLVECEEAEVRGYVEDLDGTQIEVKNLSPPCRVNWPGRR